MRTKEDLVHNFTYHPPQPDQLEHYNTLRELGKILASSMFDRCPETAERTLAIRKIEEGVMWANAAIARHGANPAWKSNIIEHKLEPDNLGTKAGSE